MAIPNRGVVGVVAISLSLAGCYALHPTNGGGQTGFVGRRQVDARDIRVPRGYRVELVAAGLTYPTQVVLARGHVYVLEGGYSYGEQFTRPRLVRVEAGGRLSVVAIGEPNVLWSGADEREGRFYVTEARALSASRIITIDEASGRIETLVDGLPTLGVHQTSSPVIRGDWLYFAQGTMTNSGVPEVRDYLGGWLRRHPDLHDVPARDVVLAGERFEETSPFTGETARTGAFSPFGTPTTRGQRIDGRLPATGAIMRVPLRGGALELVAWGLRNPFGLAFAPDGQLFAADNGYDDGGVRGVFAAPDLLWALPADAGRAAPWLGWPDFSGDEPLTWQDRYAPIGGPPLRDLLLQHPPGPPAPAARLACHASVAGLAVSTSDRFGFQGQVFVAQFGDLAPLTGKVIAPVGFDVVRVDPASGIVREFASNAGPSTGPATKLGAGGLERPIDVAFGPDGDDLYVLDFGVLLVESTGFQPCGGTGVLWRITRDLAPREAK